MRRTKKVLLWGLGTLSGTLLAAVLFLTFAGDGFYRWALDEVVEGAIDREVKVDGTFSFDLGLEPSVTVTDVWVENARWTGKKEMARAKRVEIQIALRPLLSGVLRVPRLVVEGLTVELEESAGNRRNWEIEARNNGGGSATDLEDLFYPLVDYISLTDIAVTYRDNESGREVQVRLHALKKLEQLAEDAPYEVRGEGSVNQRPFTIAAEVGSVEDAITASAPYPVEATLQSQNVFAQLSGTVENLPAGEGLDLKLLARTQSIYEVLQAFQIESRPFGPALASLRLQGDLDALAAEDIKIEIIAPSGQALTAEGRIADVTHGDGLDLRFGGKLDPQALALIGRLPPGLAAVVDGITDIDSAGRLAGSVSRPALKDLSLTAEHVSGATVSLQGAAAAARSGDDFALADFQVSTQVFLPDQSLLVQALGTRIPELREIEATADIVWSGDWITARSVTLDGKALEDVSLKGEGKLGRFSGTDLTFEPDVQADLSGTASSTRPLFYLIEGFSRGSASPTDAALNPWPAGPKAADTNTSAAVIQEIQRALLSRGADLGTPDGKMGPKTRAAIAAYQSRQGLTVNGRAGEALLRHLRQSPRIATHPDAKAPPTYELTLALPDLGATAATLRLFFADNLLRFEDLDITLGKKDAEWVNVAGFLGTLPPGPGGLLTGIDVDVSFAAPSLQRFSEIVPAEFLALKNIEGRFDVTGTEDVLSMAAIEASAEGPQGLRAGAGGAIGRVILGSNSEFADMALEIEGRWPDSQSVYAFVDQEIPDVALPNEFRPELGPVRAQATLRDRAATYALEDLLASAGPGDQPAVRVAGTIDDLTAWKGIDLSGGVEVSTAALLAGQIENLGEDFGWIRGQFSLSDADGNLGLKQLTAALDDSALISFSLTGLFSDIIEGEGLRLQTDLAVPDLAALGRRLAFDAENLGRLTYEGELVGSGEGFTADGKAMLGETEMRGTLSGSLTEQRPALQGEIFSPLFRLADIGLMPEDATEDGIAAPAPSAADPQAMLFEETPIPFEALKAIDLELEIVLDQIEGANLDIDRALARINLVDGHMKIEPLNFGFVGGNANLTLQADASGPLPEVRLEVSAQGVDLEKLLSQTEVDVPLDGEMDILMDLAASGGSPRALASSLDGKLELAIEKGHLRTGLLRLATTNPARWIFTETARNGSSAMNCLILRFDIMDGVAEGKTLLLDTPDTQAIGEGNINLQKEFFDINVDPQPKQKRLIAFSTPFKIKGPLVDPAIKINTTGASVRKSGEVLLGPVNLLGSLLPFVGGKDDDDENLCLTLKPVAPAG